MTVAAVAATLLIVRLITLGLIALVLARQFRLFRLAIDTGLVQFRIIMFSLGMVFLSGNVLPILVDFYYGFVYTTANWNSLLVAYAVSNSVSSLAAAFILWKIYKIAGADTDDSKGV